MPKMSILEKDTIWFSFTCVLNVSLKTENNNQWSLQLHLRKVARRDNLLSLLVLVLCCVAADCYSSLSICRCVCGQVLFLLILVWWIILGQGKEFVLFVFARPLGCRALLMLNLLEIMLLRITIWKSLTFHVLYVDLVGVCWLSIRRMTLKHPLLWPVMTILELMCWQDINQCVSSGFARLQRQMVMLPNLIKESMEDLLPHL